MARSNITLKHFFFTISLQYSVGANSIILLLFSDGDMLVCIVASLSGMYMGNCSLMDLVILMNSASDSL
jgi:hypothetical protein